MNIDLQAKFDEINRRAQAEYPGLLLEWFPAGKRRGHRFVVGDLGGDRAGQSVSVNISTGAWKEFSGGPGGYDAIGLFAHAKCCGDRMLAFRVLGKRFGLLDGGHEAPRKPNPAKPVLTVIKGDDWQSIVPPPPDAGEPDMGYCSYRHVYKGKDGKVLRYVARIEKPDGSKIFVPWTYGVLNGVKGWHKKHPEKPMSLYGLDRLGRHKGGKGDKAVILQEGERKADLLQHLLPSYTCLGWSGGGHRARDHDYHQVADYAVTVCGDAVDGVEAAMAAADEIHKLNGMVRVFDPTGLGFPKGWDLANAISGEMWKKGELVWKSESGPWTADQIEAFIHNNARMYDPGSAKEEKKAKVEDLDGFARNEDGIALAFAERFRDDLRYCHTTGAWFVWTGSRWQKEETKLAFCWARDVCRELNTESENFIAKAATAGAVEKFAQTDRAFAVTGAIWDRDSFLLGTPGGTVDLTTGLIRAGRQEDFMTKQTAVAPADPLHGDGCPLWLAFLEQATKGDAELIRFMQQIAGYALTGDTREHALFFIYGPGGNGKGVFLNTITKIIGDYATTAAMDTFTASQSDKHPTDLAMLKGARLVTASETEEGRAWAESRIKQMTGGDPITARFMRQDFFTFMPAFKLLIVGNHKPILRNVDEAARRRFNIIPFIHKPAKPDKQLEEKLKAEWPAILRWMIDGCLDWQTNGLVRPGSVARATDDYFNSQDMFGQWLEECCELHPGNDRRSETAADLFASWEAFLESHGEKPESSKSFGDKLSQRDVGSMQKRHPLSGKNCKWRTGISLIRPPLNGGQDE